jgi:hypothetical protein
LVQRPLPRGHRRGPRGACLRRPPPQEPARQGPASWPARSHRFLSRTHPGRLRRTSGWLIGRTLPSAPPSACTASVGRGGSHPLHRVAHKPCAARSRPSSVGGSVRLRLGCAGLSQSDPARSTLAIRS